MRNPVTSNKQQATSKILLTPYSLPLSSGSRGYTLIELIVSVGLFAIIMLLATGSYLTMIAVNRQTQGISTGINNLAFALEVMTRNIRTGTTYACGGGADCPGGANSFSFVSTTGKTILYNTYVGTSGTSLQQTVNGTASLLTDSTVNGVNITSLLFYMTGSTKTDAHQPTVIMVVSGTVNAGAGKTLPFTVQTEATMRGTDL